MRTALNAHVSWWRRRRREVACDTLRPAGRAEDIDAVAVDCVLLAALRALPRRQREVIVLRVFLDLDTRATAAALGIAPDTVRVHLHRATKALRTQLHAASEQEVTS